MAGLWSILLIVIYSLFLHADAVINVAFMKTASSSSHREFEGWQQTADRAVDGNTTALWPYVFHSHGYKTYAWWRVDLQTEVHDAEVVIYLLTDERRRRDGMTLYTSLSDFPNPTSVNWTHPENVNLCHNISDPGATEIKSSVDDVYKVVCPGEWQYLMIFTNKDILDGAILHFGEVQVMACPYSKYSEKCDKNCTNRRCQGPSNCDYDTGACGGGCQVGFTRDDCTECISGLYGVECDKDCSRRHCESQTSTCTRNNFSCQCSAGWRGEDCTTECDNGFYGDGCNESCSLHHCITSSETCNHVTGVCPGGCKAGWKGEDCREECPFGMYGRNCTLKCSERNCKTLSPTCDRVTGKCSDGCKPKWLGDDCRTTSPFDLKVIVGPVVGVLVLIILIIVIIFVIRRRRRHSDKENNGIRGNHDKDACHDNMAYVNMSELSSKRQYGGGTEDMIAENTYHEVGEVSHTRKDPVTPNKTLTYPLIKQPRQEQEEEIVDEDEMAKGVYYNIDSEEEQDPIREISVQDLAATVKKVQERKTGFDAEYMRLPVGFTSTYKDSQLPENAGKNKFRGFYPYDHNRVRLADIPGTSGSDYINASFMQSYDKKKTYIAAQATTTKTVGDFWRMIWDHKCNRIIMLTGLFEDGKVKCEQYWPNNENMDTGHFKVAVEVTDIRADFTIRHMTVTSNATKEQQSVIQYHFTSWPDHGVPDTLSLVNFIWRIRRTDTVTDGPLLVHCSAGIGRTGTYIAVDSLFDQARDTGVVDVPAYVAEMRTQRKNMIQTPEQYECVFQCLIEMTLYGDTSQTSASFVNNYINKGMDTVVGVKTLVEHTRKALSEPAEGVSDRQRMWVDGNSKFIIWYCPSIKNTRGYLQVVAPSQSLLKLLWKLVEENDVNNIIVLSQLELELTWLKGEKKKYGKITVTSQASETLTDVCVMSLQIEGLKGDPEHSRKVRLCQLKGPAVMKNLSSHLSNNVELQGLISDINPVVVLHRAEDRKSAVSFCMMGNILGEIQLDMRVDVISILRSYLKYFPDLQFSEGDVQQLHEFASKCLSTSEGSNVYENL